MNDSWTTLFDNGWILSTLAPLETPANPPLVLLHGLSGDENSLKPLALNFKRNRWIISLRGIMPAEDQGFAWAIARTHSKQGFSAAVQRFSQEWPNIRTLMDLPDTNIDLFGFSQGAAFTALLLLAFPQVIRNVAIVSGFVPEMDAEFKRPQLSGHRIFISHGTQDDVVPFAEAQRSVEFYTQRNAEVVFCKSNTRHKISAYCLQRLNDFFR